MYPFPSQSFSTWEVKRRVIHILLRYWPVVVLLGGVVVAIWLIVRRHRRQPAVRPVVPAPTPPVPTSEQVAARVPPLPVSGPSSDVVKRFVDELYEVLKGLQNGIELSTRGDRRFQVTKVDDTYVVIADRKNAPPQVKRYVCVTGQLPWFRDEPRESSQHDNIDTEGMAQVSIADVRGLITELHGAYRRFA